jgi:succinyl-diaminopimelate desuccinylase
MSKKPNNLDTIRHISHQNLKEDYEVNEVIELTKKLISIDSSDPGAYESQIERYIYTWLTERITVSAKNLPVDVKVDEIEPLEGRRCLKATIPGTTDKAAFILLCHLDTVMLGNGWNPDTPALGAILKDGRIYGRGACDMKGGMACAMLAFSDALNEIAHRNQAPHRSISLVCTCDEEDFMRGSEAAIAAGWLTANQWILDTEPTDGYIRMAHKGRTWFELTFRGQTAHASTPWRGADAIAACAEAISYIRDAIVSLPRDAELGKTTVTFGQIKGGYRPYVVPDSCTVWIDIRLVPPTTPDDAKKIVDAAITHAEKVVTKTHGFYKITGNRPAISSHINSPLLLAICKSTQHICGEKADLKIFTGYSDSAVVAGKCHNPNCASYGPGSLEIAHKPNEYVPITDLWRVHAVFSDLLKNIMWDDS